MFPNVISASRPRSWKDRRASALSCCEGENGASSPCVIMMIRDCLLDAQKISKYRMFSRGGHGLSKKLLLVFRVQILFNVV